MFLSLLVEIGDIPLGRSIKAFSLAASACAFIMMYHESTLTQAMLIIVSVDVTFQKKR